MCSLDVVELRLDTPWSHLFIYSLTVNCFNVCRESARAHARTGACQVGHVQERRGGGRRGQYSLECVPLPLSPPTPLLLPRTLFSTHPPPSLFLSLPPFLPPSSTTHCVAMQEDHLSLQAQTPDAQKRAAPSQTSASLQSAGTSMQANAAKCPQLGQRRRRRRRRQRQGRRLA